jgi:hypothetical protein
VLENTIPVDVSALYVGAEESAVKEGTVHLFLSSLEVGFVSVLIVWKLVGRVEFCLFSWRYNPPWVYFHSPVAGFSHLVFEVS